MNFIAGRCQNRFNALIDRVFSICRLEERLVCPERARQPQVLSGRDINGWRSA